MKNITQDDIGKLYHPQAALVIYGGGKETGYVEYFDMDQNGSPINAHPLTVKEAQQLAKVLDTKEEKVNTYLNPKGIMGNHILYLDPTYKGTVIWYTKATQRELYFTESLDIPNGKANVPPMLWLASKSQLFVFALKSDRRPTENTILYNAPFFNVYKDGKVCLGTIDVNSKSIASLEEFISAWEGYFFNSYFSHLMQGYNPIKGNCVSLWKTLREKGSTFPKEVLLDSGTTLKDLIR